MTAGRKTALEQPVEHDDGIKEDIARVRQVLRDIAEKEPLVLQDPEPLIFVDQFGSSSVDLKFFVWAAKTDWLKVKGRVLETVKKRFDEEGIEIPFPHLSLYKGEASEPLPVQLLRPRNPGAPTRGDAGE